MSRFTHDTSNIGNGLETFFGKLVREPLKMIACLVGRGLGLLAAAAALADRRPAGRAGHPLAEQDAQAGQPPGDGTDGADLQRPGRDLPRHQDRQGLHQRALRAEAVPPPQQGILPQVDEDRPLRFPLAPHHRVHGHPHGLPGAAGRGVAGAQGRDAAAGHPAGLAAAGPQLAACCSTVSSSARPTRCGSSPTSSAGCNAAWRPATGSSPAWTASRSIRSPKNPVPCPRHQPRACRSRACRSSISRARGSWTT